MLNLAYHMDPIFPIWKASDNMAAEEDHPEPQARAGRYIHQHCHEQFNALSGSDFAVDFLTKTASLASIQLSIFRFKSPLGNPRNSSQIAGVGSLPR